MTLQQLVQGLEDTTIEFKDLSGRELLMLCDTKLIKPAAAEARLRIIAKGFQQTHYGWLTRQDIADLGLVIRNGVCSIATKEALLRWGEKKKRERDNANLERKNATQATMNLGA